jgi:hypothetical protein
LFKATVGRRTNDQAAVDESGEEVPAESDEGADEAAVEEEPADEKAADEGAPRPQPSKAEPKPPRPKVIVPPGRPNWVESPPARGGDLDTTAVASGPFKTRAECKRALDKALKQATDDYVDWYLGQGSRSQIAYFDLDYIKEHLLRDENKYGETIHSPSVGSMEQMHALLEFDQAFRDEIDRRHKQAKIGSRLMETGLLAAGVLALLTTLFGYLKLDTATRGRCSGRLQIGAIAVILALVASGVALARWIPWM